MQKEVVVAGIGMGNQALLTEQVREDIKKAQVIIGAERMLKFAKEILTASDDFGQGKKYIQSYHPGEIAEAVKEGGENSYCVVMSGDTGFYSGAKKLKAQLEENSDIQVQLHAGISSLSYLCAAFGKDYNDISLASLHGRTENIAYKVRTNRLVFLITDGNGTEVAEHLCEYGLPEVTLYVGCQLSYEDETLFSCKAGSFETDRLSENGASCGKKRLISMLIENPEAVSKRKPLKDEYFIRGNVPMTKEAVRNQIAAMFDVPEDAVLYDIGAGTGAVSMTLAQTVPKGKVYAVECNPEGAALIEQNKRKFSMDQVHVIKGTAPDCIAGMEQPAGVFIGGSRGKLEEILLALRTSRQQAGKTEKLQLVISAVTMETLQELSSLAKHGVLIGLELMQLQVSYTVPLGNYHRLKPDNPVWLAKAYV